MTDGLLLWEDERGSCGGGKGQSDGEERKKKGSLEVTRSLSRVFLDASEQVPFWLVKSCGGGAPGLWFWLCCCYMILCYWPHILWLLSVRGDKLSISQTT